MASATDSNQQAGEALRVILPVVYIIIAIIGVIGNLIVLQIICANRFRHKSYHMLISSIVVADLLFTIIFMIIRAVSYAHLNANWFVNVEQWCKAEMYLLHIFDFVLAYSIVFLCLDRVVSPSTCCFGVRRLRSGFIISLSIWIATSYVLIPILLFDQRKVEQTFGGYLCTHNENTVKLYWLSANPKRILDFLDFLFRIIIPIGFMIALSLGICIRSNMLLLAKHKNQRNSANSANRRTGSRKGISGSLIANTSNIVAVQEIQNNLYPKKLNNMVISYVLVFCICELPYEIYRAAMIWNHNIEYDLNDTRTNFAIEIPLLILKLINRAINPFLFMCLADDDLYRNKFCRLWCFPCIPGCIGCRSCWCQDCCESIKYEMNYCLGDNARENNLLQAYLDDDTYTNNETHIPIYITKSTKTGNSNTESSFNEESIQRTSESLNNADSRLSNLKNSEKRSKY